MKKFCTVFILITIAISQLSFAEDRAVFASLMNNGFELAEQNKPIYWKFTGPDDAIILDSQIYQEGNHSVQISYKISPVEFNYSRLWKSRHLKGMTLEE